MQLEPDEVDLLGVWEVDGTHVRADSTCERIEFLTKNVLERTGGDASGWDTLFRDPNDGRLWELTHPRSDLHGGGRPRLVQISKGVAREKYEVEL